MDSRPQVYVTRRLPGGLETRLEPHTRLRVWPERGAPARAALLAELSDCEGLLCMLSDRIDDELFCGDRVGVLLLARGGEGAELAFHPADVRLVQVEVLDEVDLIGAAAAAAREVGKRAQLEQVVRLEQREPVLEIEPLARLHLLADRLQRGCAVEDGHQRLRSTTASARASSSARREAPSRLSLARLA